MSQIKLINIYYHKKYNLHLIKISSNNRDYKIIIPNSDFPNLKYYLTETNWLKRINNWNSEIITNLNIGAVELKSNKWTVSNNNYLLKLKTNLNNNNITYQKIDNLIIIKQNDSKFIIDLETGKSENEINIPKMESFDNDQENVFDINKMVGKIKNINQDLTGDWEKTLGNLIKNFLKDPDKIKKIISSINDDPKNIINILIPSLQKDNLNLGNLIKKIGIKLKLTESLFNQYNSEIKNRTDNFTIINPNNNKLFNRLLNAVWESIKDILIDINKFENKIKLSHSEIKLVSLEPFDDIIKDYQNELSQLMIDINILNNDILQLNQQKLANLLQKFNQHLDSKFIHLADIFNIISDDSINEEKGINLYKKQENELDIISESPTITNDDIPNLYSGPKSKFNK